MRKNYPVLFALISMVGSGAQFFLMLENRVTSIPETIIRFL